MSGYGDDDPEDAYDAGDPVEERLRIIALIIIAARADPDRRTLRLSGARRLLLRLADELEHEA